MFFKFFKYVFLITLNIQYVTNNIDRNVVEKWKKA